MRRRTSMERAEEPAREPSGGRRRRDRGGRAADRVQPRGPIGRPSRRASASYRLVLLVLRFVGRVVFALHPELVGEGHLPRTADGRHAGGWIAAGLPHRTWVDPFLVADLLPVQPRLWFFGDGRTMFRSWWRRALVRRLGGVIPIWPGGGRNAVESHIAAARAVVEAGGVLLVFPEVGPPTPPGRARPIGLGVAYFALRTGAPVVPLVLAGNDELFRGRRLRVEALEPITARKLGGLDPDARLPEPWSPEERALAHVIVQRLHELSAPAVAAANEALRPPEGTRKRWRWLTTAWH